MSVFLPSRTFVPSPSLTKVTRPIKRRKENRTRYKPLTRKDYLYGAAQDVDILGKYGGNTDVEGDFTTPRLTAQDLLDQYTTKTKYSVENTGEYDRYGEGGFRLPRFKGEIFASDGAPEVVEEEVEEKVDVPKADSDADNGTDLRGDVYRSNQEIFEELFDRADKYVQQGIEEREAEALRDLRRYALQGELAQEGRRELTRRKIQEANINAWRDLNKARIEAGSKAAVAVGLGAYAASRPDPNLMAQLSNATNVGMGGRQAPRPAAITIATKL
jgi:hypothetical protein